MSHLRVFITAVTALLLVACSSGSDGGHASGPWARARPSGRVVESGPCPVTRTSQPEAQAQLMPGLGTRNLLGPGPVYPGAYTNQRRWRHHTVLGMVIPRQPDAPRPSGWLGQKVLWKIANEYHGPVWTRGRAVGATGRVRFSDRANVTAGLHLRARGAWPSETFIPHAGCYAWHIRGRGFHLVLVFRAVCVSGTGLRSCA